MPTLKIAFNKTTNVATVLDSGGSVPGGSVGVGTFVHPDATYPDSLVIFHGVRDLLYKRSAKDPASLALSVAADTANGKTVTIVAMPVGSSAGALSIKTAPDSARATATIAGNVLTVKPVVAGDATSVVVTNGTVDVTIAVTVAE